MTNTQYPGFLSVINNLAWENTTLLHEALQ
jgi:hypothetical protein